MRRLLFVILVVISGAANAQFGVIVGGSGDCHEVARQIVSNWIDVRDLMTDDSKTKRPMASQLQCVSPAVVETLNGRRAGGSSLRCYRVQQTGVCCDAQLQACAAL
jgi:hypothetical protein